MNKTIMIVAVLAVSGVVGCSTWHGLGRDIGQAGDAMAGEGQYVMTVPATPDRVTAAARQAVEQLSMTGIGSSGGRSEGTVTAMTLQQEKVTIDVEQSGDTASTVTIHLRGGNADEVSKQIQDRIRGNL